MGSLRALTCSFGQFALVLSLGLVACGGKQELNFVGSGTDGRDGKGGSSSVSASCGDRVVDADEQCDDGDRADGDGCSGGCSLEDGYTCAGEPSVCVKCGNGTVEAPEECDDGNGDAADGCSAACTIEGSCETPTVIALTKDGEGLSGSVSSTTGESESGQVGAADCAGAMLGAGAERIFEIELPSAADLEVRVGANFDAIVRVLTSPCDLATELPGTCVDDAAVSAEELVQINSVSKGKYYIVVDGKSAQQAGDFSVEVSAGCPLEGLKISRVILQEPFRTHILNTNATCAIDLSRVGVYAQPETADTPKTLPAVALEPLGRRVLTSESPPPAGTSYQGNIRYELEDYAGAFYLCRGECDSASGNNVIDAFRWKGSSGAPSSDPPSAVSFDADAPAFTDRLGMSYFRVLQDGAFPNFSADDYQPAFFAETFEDGKLPGWEPFADLFYDAAFEAPEGTIGKFALALQGGNPTAAVWNGPKFKFRDNLGGVAALRPSYVSLWVRGSDKTLNHGQIFFGNPGTPGNPTAEANGFGSLFRDNGTLGFGSPTVSVFQASQAKTWYFVEYKITYAGAGANGLVEVYVDGTSRGSFSMSNPSVSQLSIRNLEAAATLWVDQIIVQ